MHTHIHTHTHTHTYTYAHARAHAQIPWNSGQIIQAPIPPFVMNCPRATSMKKSGIPPMMTQIKYGIKNAPEN